MEGRDSYGWGLVFLCLDVRDSYVYAPINVFPHPGEGGHTHGHLTFSFFSCQKPLPLGATLWSNLPIPGFGPVVNVFEQTKALLFNAHFIAVISPVQT